MSKIPVSILMSCPRKEMGFLISFFYIICCLLAMCDGSESNGFKPYFACFVLVQVSFKVVSCENHTTLIKNKVECNGQVSNNL